MKNYYSSQGPWECNWRLNPEPHILSNCITELSLQGYSLYGKLEISNIMITLLKCNYVIQGKVSNLGHNWHQHLSNQLFLMLYNGIHSDLLPG